MIITVGVDLGKVRDPSAIVITEYMPVRVQENGEWWPDVGAPDPAKKWIMTVKDTLYQVRMIERVELGTSYPAVGRKINAICRRLRKEKPDAKIHLLMDQTGVGRGPVDIVRELLDSSIQLTAVNFNGTDRCDTAPLYRPEIGMGKAYMVVRMQTTLQKRLLQLPKDKPPKRLIADLVDELKTFEVKTARNGHDTYGAFAVGTHDDLVCALGLSILGDAHMPGMTVGPRIYT